MSKKKKSKFEEVYEVDNDLKFLVQFSNMFYHFLDTFEVSLDSDLEFDASFVKDYLRQMRKNYRNFLCSCVTEIIKKYK